MQLKLLFIVLTLLLIFCACTSEEEPEVVELSVSERAITVQPEGGSHKIAVSCNVDWQAEFNYNDYYWCAIDATQANGDTIYIEVSRTESEQPRETRIIVQNSNTAGRIIVADTIMVTQSGWTVPEEGVLINGTIWARYNVETFGTFTESLLEVGKLYQFNNATAYTITNTDGLLSVAPNWNPVSFTDIWLPENNPCPAGWRIPTQEEVFALVKSGYKYDSTLNGFFFGRDSQIATIEEPNGCIFLPSGGFIENGEVVDILQAGRYWVKNGCTVSDNSVFYRYLQFYSNSENDLAELAYIATHDINYAFSIRCVKE